MAVSCYRITATLTATTPLHLGSGRRTGVIKHTYPYIPGSMLRGSLGTVLLKAICKLDRPIVNHEECEYFKDCLYANLFGEEFGKASRIFFRYAYPLHLKCGGTYFPASKTLYVCKKRQCKKVYDRLVPPDACETCGGAVKANSGFRCDRCGELERYPVSISRVTLTALDRDRASAAQIQGPEEVSGTLHTLELVDRGSWFALELLVHRDSKEDLDTIKAALERGVPDEGIGGGKSRGLGKVKVDDLKVCEVTTKSVEERAKEIDSRNFAVRLLSPMLLDGGLLEPQTLLEGARRAYTWVFHEGKPTLPSIQLSDKRIAIETFSGWSLKEQRRRRIEAAISPGSVFQFKGGGENETLALALAALEFYAIGSYKPHGCGQVVIEGAR